MFTEFRRSTRESFTCLVFAMVIVASCLSLGAIGTEMVVRNAQAVTAAHGQV